jgi:hypothetical protein
MHPIELQRSLESKLDNLSQSVMVILGDCCPSIESVEKRFNCLKTPAVNCCELLLGHDRYLEYRNKKIFILLPEWTGRWREVFQQELGFSNNSELAHSFMHENSSSIEYFDTGIVDVPNHIINDIQTFFDMPVKVTPVNLNTLRKFISDTLTNLEKMEPNGK